MWAPARIQPKTHHGFDKGENVLAFVLTVRIGHECFIANGNNPLIGLCAVAVAVALAPQRE